MTPRVSAVAVAFVANGLGGPSFLPRLPERQAALGLSDVGLGLVLVGMALGALVASPFAGRVVGRTGSRPVVVVAATTLGASLWTAGAAPRPVVLVVAILADKEWRESTRRAGRAAARNRCVSDQVGEELRHVLGRRRDEVGAAGVVVVPADPVLHGSQLPRDLRIGRPLHQLPMDGEDLFRF